MLAALLALAIAVPLVAVNTKPQSQVTVTSQSASGKSISGYVVLYQNGNPVSTGFTPVAFVLSNGHSYSARVENSGGCTFSSWSDGVTTNPRSFDANGSISLTATYNCAPRMSTVGVSQGASGGGVERGAGPGTITIYDHRVPQPNWANCFATACRAGTGPNASMWVVLYDSTGKVLATGLANENGLTFTGLDPSAVYYLYPADCDHCHNSTHNVLFDYWASGGGDARPRAVMADGSYYDAWYICSNGCGD